MLQLVCRSETIFVFLLPIVEAIYNFVIRNLPEVLEGARVLERACSF